MLAPRKTVADVIPDAIDPVIGWRAWRVTGPLLVSMNDTPWTPGVALTAECRSTAHTPPDPRCSCGLYAAKSADHLRGMGYNRYDGDDFVAVGEVMLWGGVIEGTQGWRAQFGYPRRLYVPFEAWRLVAGLREQYGVPVKLANTFTLEA